MRKSFTFVIGLSFASAFLSQNLMADEIPVIQPGESYNFRAEELLRVEPDGIGSDTSYIPTKGFAAASDHTVPLSTFVHAVRSLANSHAEAVQYNDFYLFPVGDNERLITAQFSGNVNVRGFMLIIGQGEVNVKVSLQLLDITDDPENGKLIASYPLHSDSLTNSIGFEMGASVSGLIGSATIVQAGGDLDFSVGYSVERKLIRENVDFGFSALVRRGHQYRIQILSESNGQLGVMGGRAIASFYSPLAPIPNGISDPLLLSIPAPLLDPLEWLETVDMPLLDKELPSFDVPSTIFNFTSPAKTLTLAGWGSDYSINVPSKNINIAPKFPSPFNPGNNTNDILEELGFKTNLKDILIKNLDKPIPENLFELPGVELRELSVDVEDDIYEEFEALHAEIAELKAIMLEQPFYQNPRRGPAPTTPPRRSSTR